MKIIPVLFTLSMALFLFACGDDDSAPSCNTDNITYTNTIEKIIADAGCAQMGCHASGSMLGSGSLANYDDAKEFVNKGRILGALRREDNFAEMPRDPATGNAAAKLADCDIDKIEAWITAGAPE
ncbi:MAG TPA: hypothetical protein ENJ95_20545 [Bacteroidetes bacterium]|nr:hypothetical protein [Bacteroidota bacterium]